MGRLRRSRLWISCIAAVAVLGVALNGVAAAQTDPPVSTDAPTTTTTSPSPPLPPNTTAAAPATTRPAAPPGGSSGTAGPVRGAATAGPDSGPPSPGGGSAAAAAVDVADVALSVVDTPDPVVAGNNISYAITVTNNGPSDAANVLLQDQVTGSETFVSSMQNSAPSAFCLFPPVGSVGSVNCSITNLPAGASAVFTVVVTVAPGTPTGTVLNPASVTSATTDPDTSNNSAITPTCVQAQSADLAVTKTDTPDPVVPGGNITYAITVSNGGPSDATSVNLQDAMPFNTTFVSLTPATGWSCTTPSVGSTGLAQCSAALLANGATAVFTLVVHVSPAAANGSTITNNAFANSQGADDPNMLNNTGSAQTAVQSADMAVTKTDSLDPVPAGANFTYTITVANNGPAVAQNVTMSDPLPASTTFVSLSPASGWSCTVPSVGATGTVSCAAPSLGNGGSAVFSLVVTVSAGLSDGTVISNTIVPRGVV